MNKDETFNTNFSWTFAVVHDSIILSYSGSPRRHALTVIMPHCSMWLMFHDFLVKFFLAL